MLPKADTFGDARLLAWFFEQLGMLYYRRDDGRDRFGRCLEFLEKALSIVARMQLTKEQERLKKTLRNLKKLKKEQRRR